MSIRKPLLTESELRRFMKLANMGTVGTGRLTEMGFNSLKEMPYEEEEEELELGPEDEVPAIDDWEWNQRLKWVGKKTL